MHSPIHVSHVMNFHSRGHMHVGTHLQSNTVCIRVTYSVHARNTTNSVKQYIYLLLIAFYIYISIYEWMQNNTLQTDNIMHNIMYNKYII